MDFPRIASVEARPFDVPMRLPYRSAQRVTTVARNVLVTVTLADGTVGYGESAPATYVTGESQESVLLTIQDSIPMLLRSPELLFDRNFLPASPGAKGALETAFMDANARHDGTPFLGSNDALFTLSTDLSLPILPPDEAAFRASNAAKQGFTSIKIKVGSGLVSSDIARVRAVANAAPNVKLRLDGNQGFSAEEAIRFLENLSDLESRIELVEQPTKAYEDAEMKFVAERIPYPVFADESCHNGDDAKRLLETGTCKGIVLKIAKSGISGTIAIASRVRLWEGYCMFGCMMESRIGIGAALYLAATIGTSTVSLFDLDSLMLVDDTALLTGGPTMNGPLLSLDPNAPGLGVHLLPERSA